MTNEAFLTNYDEWPLWPFLPLRSLTAEPHTPPSYGIMIESGEHPFRVYSGCDVFSLGERPGETYREKFAGLTIHDYTSAEALLKEWRID